MLNKSGLDKYGSGYNAIEDFCEQCDEHCSWIEQEVPWIEQEVPWIE